jgi:hypothetical protein
MVNSETVNGNGFYFLPAGKCVIFGDFTDKNAIQNVR